MALSIFFNFGLSETKDILFRRFGLREQESETLTCHRVLARLISSIIIPNCEASILCYTTAQNEILQYILWPLAVRKNLSQLEIHTAQITPI